MAMANSGRLRCQGGSRFEVNLINAAADRLLKQRPRPIGRRRHRHRPIDSPTGRDKSRGESAARYRRPRRRKKKEETKKEEEISIGVAKCIPQCGCGFFFVQEPIESSEAANFPMVFYFKSVL